MSQLLPSPISCNESCAPNSTSGPPGEQGATGAAGADGDDGVNAYTFVASNSPAAQPVMPAEGDTVTVTTTTSTAFLQANQFVYVAFWGYMKVYSVPSSTTVVLLNPEVTADGTYAENAAAGTTLPAGSRITLAGIQGPAGDEVGGALLAANDLNDVADPATSRSNLGLGTMAVQGAGAVAITGGSIAGITDLAVADGGTGASDAATARTNLGLGTMAIQAATAVNIDGGAIDGTPVGATSASTGSFTTLASSGAATLASAAIAGTASVNGTLFTAASATQSLVAANAITPNAAKIKVVGSGGAVTLTSTPSITAPVADGQLLLIQGMHDTNTLTVQDSGTLPASGLRLGATTRALGLGDILLLTWDAATSSWYEVSFTAQV
jgi:hypothetical protein